MSTGMTIFYNIVSKKDALLLHDRLRKEDPQSAELLLDVIHKLQQELDLDPATTSALSRVMGVVKSGRSWDTALLRNNIFKAANSLGMELPSHMF